MSAASVIAVRGPQLHAADQRRCLGAMVVRRLQQALGRTGVLSGPIAQPARHSGVQDRSLDVRPRLHGGVFARGVAGVTLQSPTVCK